MPPDEAKPYPKSAQLARGERRYRRKIASPKAWQAIIAAKIGPCRVCNDPGSGVGAEGYVRAGWHVAGVDIAPQPHYRGHEFIQADVLEFLHPWQARLDFDAAHASPPCQFATDYQRRPGHVRHHENLIPVTRDLLNGTRLPWVIENVEKAAPWLREPVLLCGSMFDLDVQRHRLFETSWLLSAHEWPCRHDIWTPRFPAATNRVENSRRTVEIGVWRIPLDVQKAAMGVDWEIDREELSLGDSSGVYRVRRAAVARADSGGRGVTLCDRPRSTNSHPQP